MRQISKKSDLDQALPADDASFQAITKRSVTRTGRQTTSAAAAAYQNALASTLKNKAHDDMPSGTSEDRIHTTSARVDSPPP